MRGRARVNLNKESGRGSNRTNMTSGASLEEIEGVYRRCRDEFVRVAIAMTRDPDVGADAVHDAFVSCVKARRSYRRDGPIEGWIAKAVVNSALKATRRKRTDDVGSLTATFDTEEPPLEFRENVRSAIKALPERERVILFLAHYTDMNYQNIGEALGISPGTVGAALHSARQTLRHRLAEVTVESA